MNTLFLVKEISGYQPRTFSGRNPAPFSHSIIVLCITCIYSIVEQSVNITLVRRVTYEDDFLSITKVKRFQQEAESLGKSYIMKHINPSRQLKYVKGGLNIMAKASHNLSVELAWMNG